MRVARPSDAALFPDDPRVPLVFGALRASFGVWGSQPQRGAGQRPARRRT